MVMRTTLNLDDDVVARLNEQAAQEGRSLSRVANDLMRSGLRAENDHRASPPYEPPVFDTGRAKVDVTDIAAVLDLLDDAG
jgi:hypothetical protein